MSGTYPFRIITAAKWGRPTLPPACLLQNLLVGHVHPDGGKRGGDGAVAAIPILPEPGEPILQRTAAGFQEEDYQMQASAVPLAREFDARNQLDAEPFGRAPRFLDALQRVVIGQGDRPETGLGGQPDHFGRGFAPVGRGRMGMQVDGHPGGRLTSGRWPPDPLELTI